MAQGGSRLRPFLHSSMRSNKNHIINGITNNHAFRRTVQSSY